ncbi:MAG: SDR family NAD(P)-dependent oxidoreductase [Anaerolineae bacterium]|nr:SDR family NAD(P)-dependent oxidoreductase [Anaerolineae bacterium]
MRSVLMRCLITGASGLVGANLVEAATERGYTVRAMHRKSSSLKALQGLRYESALGDVTDMPSLEAAVKGIDIVFHVAAIATYWKADVQQMYHVNVEGTRNVLQAARDAKAKRVVFTSSVSALGQPGFGKALDESAAFNLKPEQFHYAYTKVLAEQVVQEFVNDGLDVVTVNPTIIMGPRDVNVIGGAMVLEAARQHLFYYPPGGTNMVDVADVCTGHLAAAERGRTGERYVLGGENLWYKELLNVVNDAMGRPRPWLKTPGGLLRAMAGPADWARDKLKLKLPIDGQQLRLSAETFWFDSGKARNELGFTHRPFAETVARTHEWYKANGYLK